MKEVIFDSSRIESAEDLHVAIARLLKFPKHYGKNLDALYDCLSGDVKLPVRFVWKNYYETEKKIGSDAEAILQTMQDFAAEEEDFSVVIL